MWCELMVLKAADFVEKDRVVGQLFLTRLMGVYDLLIISNRRRWLKRVRKVLEKEGYDRVQVVGKSVFYGYPAVLLDSFSTLRDANNGFNVVRKIVDGGM